MNYFKTAVLLIALTVLLIWVGSMFGGQQGAIFAFAIAMCMNFFSYWFSDKIVLKMYGASEISERDSPTYYDIVRELAANANLPMPRMYIIPTNSMNAFATGRNPRHAAVAVTEGLMNSMSRAELKCVIGHELSHVRNRDILISTIVATIAGAVMMLANIARWGAMFGGFGGRDEGDRRGGGLAVLFLAILAPLAALLIQMAISRSREYAADSGSARLTGNPLGLASALEKLHQAAIARPMHAGQATAHLFIVNPLSGRSFVSIFSTHPPVEERIKRLRAMV